MAEFKLGRIRFVWKGSWSNGQVYYKDDVIRYGGKTYICAIGHTSSADFNTDLEYNPTKWNQMTDGQDWKGDWSTSTFYKINDLVKYGGQIYICNDSHTSAVNVSLGLENDLAKWTLFSEGFDWKGPWAISTRYKINDTVQYGGYTYVCIEGHTSAATVVSGLEADQAKWQIFNPGIEYKGAWSGSSVKYKLNDVVRYGAGLWICTTAHSSTASFVTDQSNWSQFVKGVDFIGDWLIGTNYAIGDVVSYGGNQYVAKTNNVGATPSTSTSDWALFNEGFNFIGDWSNVTVYKPGDVVRLNGYTYLATADSTGQEPPNASFWQLLNQGIQWRGEWQNSTAYKLGDAVRFNQNAYICVLAHTSNDDDSTTTGDLTRSPATDSTGTYWNVLAVGSETSVLTTPGDLVYYGGNGPTRLPIGIEGQVLRAGNEYPEWASLSSVDHEYYVAPHGVDLPAPIHGKSFDKPWKTIRYACMQVENGPRNPNAKYLLELNRVFIQREVSEWIQYQVTNNIAPFTTSFDFDEYKCERDVGFIVDALIYDLGHGGNVKIRGAANSYVGGLSESETIVYGSGLSNEDSESVAALNYMVVVAKNVLDQVAPTVNYQTTNGDNSTSVVVQSFNADLIAEDGVKDTVEDLVQIVTDAITAGDPDDIPARYSPSNLIRVATGRYREVLPIIVPEQTCVLGDELRSTNAGPIESTTTAEDVLYSSLSLARLSTAAQAISTGSAFTATVGNSSTRSQEWPYAESGDATTIAKLFDSIRYNIDFRTGAQAVNSLFNGNTGIPTGYNSAYLVGYGDARKLIIENKKFFQEQVKAYLIANYPNLKYSKTACMKDVGYIVDAVAYDLTYGGNAQSVQAGLAYYEGVGSTLVIDSSELTATLAAYGYLRSIMQDAANNTVVTANQTIIPQFRGTAGAAAAITLIGDNLNEIIDIITNGPAAETLTDPSTSWVSGALTSAYSTLNSAVTTIQSNTITFINTNFPSLTYNSAKCSRDIGIILKAVGYDFMFDTNFQTIVAGRSYLRSTATEVFSLGQKAATRAALEYVRTQAIANVGGNATAIARINALMYLIDTIIYTGSNEGSRCATDDRTADYAVLQLERNRDYLVSEISAYITETFKTTITNTTATTNVLTLGSGFSLWRRNTAVRFTGTVFGGVQLATTYYIQDIDYFTGTVKLATTRNATTAITLSTASGSMTMSLYYDTALCLRDVNSYIDAIKYDVKYPGNYKSLFAARYYANSVIGSLEEDMYYLRDSTGVRDMTLEGLTGDLLAPNAYGTSRVSAGAYCSLDPGWGPEDYRTWIITRSPYVQGVTTIGTGAIGQKIDGALHNGGNDSIVSNDFTQVISDGIGAWVANNGRAELVSVFTYYAHIGYLSTEGGRIRGTNGNCSYGDFGAVAEGVDASETPGTAVVDNIFQYEAVVGSVFTNGSNILEFEFDNAGIDYSEVTYTVTGGGTNAEVVADEFRDGGVYEVRLLDFGDDSSGQLGGDGYVTASNTAQGGTSTSITLSATDDRSSTSYVGMRLTITGGEGTGQFGIISSYSSASKIANIVKTNGSSGFEHIISGTAIVAPDGSSVYTIEPAITFSAPRFESYRSTASIASGVYNEVVYGATVESFTSLSGTYSGSGSGATFDVVKQGFKYLVTIATAGTNYQRLQTITILGTNLGGSSPANDLVLTITAVNSTSGAILAFDQTGQGRTGRFVAVRNSATQAVQSVDGITWTAASLGGASTNWTTVAHGLFDDGSSAVKVSKFVALNNSNRVVYSSDAVTWNSSTLPTSAAWVGAAFGENRFVAIASDSTTVGITLDGEVWDRTGNLPSTGYTAITYGRETYVAVRSGTSNAAYSTDGGVTWTAVTIPGGSATWSGVAFGNNIFVAVAANSNDGAYSIDGITWTRVTIGSVDGSTVAGFQKVKYSQGLFMVTSYAAGSQDYSYVSTSEDGLLWTTRGIEGIPNACSGYNAIACGVNQSRRPVWVAIEKDSVDEVTYIYAGARAKARAFISDEKILAIRITDPGSGYTNVSGVSDGTVSLTITDPNNTYEAPYSIRVGNGVLSNPTFINRGTLYVTGSAEVQSGDGFADFYQIGSFIAVRRITTRPAVGSNVTFASLPGRTFKLVSVLTFRGSADGSYSAFYQISPQITIAEAPEHLTGITTRIRYSQVRLTGHDFLDIGTGNFIETNYPGIPTQPAVPANETVESNGGRVFFTSTDQDGNFRVGDLFSVEQSTGIATLNADAFNISGLQELSLGNVTLGGGSATITEFSTDPFFTADSDNIVPTQRAIKAYISSQIGGGGASLNVNSVTAGSIVINTNTITTASGSGSITMNAVFDFRRPITGYPLAFNYFLT